MSDSITECIHNVRCRYTNGFYCEDCNTFFSRESKTYRSNELLSSIWMVLHNLYIDNKDKELLVMKQKIGIGIKHKNYEELINESEILMQKYNVNSKSAYLEIQSK